MLRVFRLDPTFEFEHNPTNIIYIDVDSEQEITRKYVEKQDTRWEFKNSIVGVERDNLYLRNYLVLKEKSNDILPTISDIEIMKEIPGSYLPNKYWLDTSEEYVSFEKTETLVNNSQELILPANFLISIRSEYSDYEKLTVDQNEALLCSLAYYYPRPLPRAMIISESSSLRPQLFPHKPLIYSNSYEMSILYKGAWVLPKILPQEPVRNIDSWLHNTSITNLSPVYFIYNDDNDVEMISPKHKSHINVYDIPPPLHSRFLLNYQYRSTGIHPRMRPIAQLKGELYSEAVVPNYEQLIDISPSP